MSSGTFGSVRPANLNIETDVEMFYMFRPSRGETDKDFTDFKTLEPTECLVATRSEGNIMLNGLYTLRLPLDKFNKKGFYTIYIRPKEENIEITDVSVLASYPDIKGVILKTDGLPTKDLTGYRLEFIDGTTRLIKSCNFCEPVIVNTGDGYPKATRYNLNVSTQSLVFCTVTPSSSPTFKPNAKPYIGEPGVSVKLVNTKFSPQIIEVEMVTHDMDTLSYMLEGDQVNDRDNAIITTYNDKKEIYHQSDYYVLKDSLGKPIYNVRTKRSVIDVNQEYDNIID
jgi:hypothetical protein